MDSPGRGAERRTTTRPDDRVFNRSLGAIRRKVRPWAQKASTFDPTASALARPAPTPEHAWPAAIRLEAHVTNVVDIRGDGGQRNAGPAEREKLAGIFEAIGNATNATLREMPEFSDEMIRRQMTLCFASVGGFVMYADILRQGTKPSYPDGIGAIIQLGRALDRRITLKP